MGDPKCIVVYSPDRDLCESLKMLLQDRFRVVTVRDLHHLSAEVGSSRPAMLVADVEPTQRMSEMFRVLKSADECLKIILFYAPRFQDLPLDREVRRQLDAVLYKPIDLDTFTHRVEELLQPA